MNFGNHAFKDLDQSLQGLQALLEATVALLLEMHDLCKQALASFADKTKVKELLAQAKALDKQINALEFENTAIIQDIFGKYNPRGHDLRFIIGSVKLSTLLESMADKTKNNIKRIGKAEALPSPSIAAHAQEMLEESTALLTLLQQLLLGFNIETSDAMVAGRRRIEALYREIWLQQTQVDVSYHNLVMLAKNIERNVDILSDIRKILYFIHTGEKLVKKKKAALS